MVKFHIKRGDESQFLYDTRTDTPLSQLIPHLVSLFNGRLKVDRLCQGSAGCALIRDFVSRQLYTWFLSLIEIELLSQHGIMLPPDMLGLTEEQVSNCYDCVCGCVGVCVCVWVWVDVCVCVCVCEGGCVLC